VNNNLNNNGAGFEIEETNSLKDYVNLIKLNLIPILLITLTGLTVAIIFHHIKTNPPSHILKTHFNVLIFTLYVKLIDI